MTAVSALAREIAEALVEAIESNDEIATRLRARLSATPVEPTAMFATVANYAHRVGFSRRSIENMIRDGLPTIGVGSGLRIDVERADAWVRLRRAPRPDVSPEEAAERGRAAARERSS